MSLFSPTQSSRKKSSSSSSALASQLPPPTERLSKLKGEGSYGCVMANPHLKCKNGQNDDGIFAVTKVFGTMEKMQEEYNELTNVIHKIDKEGYFTLAKVDKCEYDERDKSNNKSIRQCEKLYPNEFEESLVAKLHPGQFEEYLRHKGRSEKEIQEALKNDYQMGLLLMDDGGVNLWEFPTQLLNDPNRSLEEKRNIATNLFWSEVYRLFYGVLKLRENRVMHRDLKPDNIVYNVDTNRINMIDFGLLSTCEKQLDLMNDESKLAAESSTLTYYVWPIERLFLSNFVHKKYIEYLGASGGNSSTSSSNQHDENDFLYFLLKLRVDVDDDAKIRYHNKLVKYYQQKVKIATSEIDRKAYEEKINDVQDNPLPEDWVNKLPLAFDLVKIFCLSNIERFIFRNNDSLWDQFHDEFQRFLRDLSGSQRLSYEENYKLLPQLTIETYDSYALGLTLVNVLHSLESLMKPSHEELFSALEKLFQSMYNPYVGHRTTPKNALLMYEKILLKYRIRKPPPPASVAVAAAEASAPVPEAQKEQALLSQSPPLKRQRSEGDMIQDTTTDVVGGRRPRHRHRRRNSTRKRKQKRQSRRRRRSNYNRNYYK